MAWNRLIPAATDQTSFGPGYGTWGWGYGGPF